jgi:hypothetical protein
MKSCISSSEKIAREMVGEGGGERNDSNNLHTCESMNNKIFSIT